MSKNLTLKDKTIIHQQRKKCF